MSDELLAALSALDRANHSPLCFNGRVLDVRRCVCSKSEVSTVALHKRLLEARAEALREAADAIEAAPGGWKDRTSVLAEVEYLRGRAEGILTYATNETGYCAADTNCVKVPWHTDEHMDDR